MLPAGPAALGLLRCACCTMLSRRRKPPACPLLSPIATAGFGAGSSAQPRPRQAAQQAGCWGGCLPTHAPTCVPPAADESGRLRVTLDFIKAMLQVNLHAPCFNPASTIPRCPCQAGLFGMRWLLAWHVRFTVIRLELNPPSPAHCTLQAFREERLIHRRYAFEIILQV